MLRKLTMGVGGNYPLSLLRINSQEVSNFLEDENGNSVSGPYPFRERTTQANEK